jgi:L-amino acid N-acyltransferase YncA
VAHHIGAMERRDWVQVRAIYGQGLATGIAAFMTAPPMWKAWDAGHLPVGRIVARDDARNGDGRVLGWAALAPVADT